MQGEEDSSIPVGEETIEFITPHAFSVEPSLIGIPLAKPWKRLLALGIDGFLISLISSINIVFLFLITSALFFYISSPKRKKGGVFPEVFSERKRKLIRRLFWFFGFAILAISLLVMFLIWAKGDDLLFEQSDGWEANRFVTINESLSSYAERLQDADCQSPECMEELISEIDQDLKQHGLRAEIQALLIEDLRQQAQAHFQQTQAVQIDTVETPNPSESIETEQTEPVKLDEIIDAIEESSESKKESYSIVGWGKGLMNDLGLGLGWTTLYFTLFVSRWRGQTPGKKLLRLRVIQLDGTPLSLWESFGRYGGYAAGLSTGLLGFLQIFWDPNRQAIQDKISSTVVVDLSKPRFHGHPDYDSLKEAEQPKAIESKDCEPPTKPTA